MIIGVQKNRMNFEAIPSEATVLTGMPLKADSLV